MNKVIIRLDLSRYSVEELLDLYSLQILNRDEVMEEMRERGMKDLEIIGRIRAVG